jgi:hypothetical protein
MSLADGSLPMAETHDFSRQRLARFLAVRIKRLKDEANASLKISEGSGSTSAPCSAMNQPSQADHGVRPGLPISSLVPRSLVNDD